MKRLSDIFSIINVIFSLVILVISFGRNDGIMTAYVFSMIYLLYFIYYREDIPYRYSAWETSLMACITLIYIAYSFNWNILIFIACIGLVANLEYYIFKYHEWKEREFTKEDIKRIYSNHALELLTLVFVIVTCYLQSLSVLKIMFIIFTIANISNFIRKVKAQTVIDIDVPRNRKILSRTLLCLIAFAFMVLSLMRIDILIPVSISLAMFFIYYLIKWVGNLKSNVLSENVDYQ